MKKTKIIEKANLIAKENLISNRYEHAKRVVDILCKYAASEKEIAAAYLHDIFEDTHLSEEYVSKEVGEEICIIAQELTNPPEDYEDRSFRHMKNASKEAKRIKLCDRIDNISKRIENSQKYGKKKIDSYIEESEILAEMLKDSDENLYFFLKERINLLQKK